MIRFRTIRLTSLSARERDLLNAYYIEDLKYVNRRLSIPSGLFSSPKRVPSIHEPNQHRLPLIRTREPPLSTLLTALFLSKCNRIDPEGEIRFLRDIGVLFTPAISPALRSLS